jgi:hypothetical protein
MENTFRDKTKKKRKIIVILMPLQIKLNLLPALFQSLTRGLLTPDLKRTDMPAQRASE